MVEVNLSRLYRTRYVPNASVTVLSAFDVLFLFCTSFDTVGGGAIACFPISDFSMDIVRCSFISCGTYDSSTQKNFGGAIAFNAADCCGKLSITIEKSCSMNCSAKCAAFLSVSSSFASDIRVIINSTFITFKSGDCRAGIWARGIDGTINDFNISKSHASRDVGFQTSTSLPLYSFHGTFFNNSVRFISLFSISNNLFDSCNFVSNVVDESKESTYLFMVLSGVTNVTRCVFCYNEKKFSLKFGSLNFFDCYLDHLYLISPEKVDFTFEGGDSNTIAPTISLSNTSFDLCFDTIDQCSEDHHLANVSKSDFYGYSCAIIKECLFSELHNPISGGAIFCDSYCSVFYITFCTFNRCTSEEFGGAVFLSDVILYSEFLRCCAQECSSRIGSFLGISSNKKDKKDIHINTSSCVRCPYLVAKPQLAGVFARYPHKTIHLNGWNTSSASVGMIFSAIQFSSNSSFRYTNIESCYSGSYGIIWTPEESTIDYMNFVNNSHFDTTKGLITIIKNLMIGGFVAKKNQPDSPLIMGKQSTLLIVFRDCFIDSFIDSDLSISGMQPVFDNNIQTNNLDSYMIINCYPSVTVQPYHISTKYALFLTYLVLGAFSLIFAPLYLLEKKKRSENEQLSREMLVDMQ